MRSGVGVDRAQERTRSEDSHRQELFAVAVLDVGGVHDRLHQQAP